MINGIQNSFFSTAAPSSSIKAADVQKSFANFLKDAIQQVNDQQVAADQLTDKLVKGENVDLHQVMIAAQKAGISLQLAVEVRNKAVEAYQEMMRMQV
ncbi:flagellar hook-basal body complex protein FliE [Anoxybacillus sp. B7M1]|jgi:flagellar hook-basal body complex protein FliE|uniref:Flagellar hook-basal body complex protein FliE n=1 Tax=Anoxybacteroides rupiense TaxID=311460 RepID=A0ABD5IQE7_9BACL|nr:MULTISPECIES: flagellar hook-basal body complex protein FliE [Anoxybacillus]ANB55943.1 flagellar hook-basal body complex protein FliE [Anoxybacillus sp. B2M1]ANB65411.1 flagellar hook-basal body complex protein FliE [Anoxybacillus sp. B7M1]KXG10545.1 Flagellar hook-basal body complex protein FliE [Anoxybacillus sp. P3H1B]MBB3906171.1 flagellar hook-basal body complex protein FliE [Anoxybacillus rupiensis]MBS2771004.1 flagellar hook-basal body complex protein FliE [Anoxybacillus rupiensis]